MNDVQAAIAGADDNQIIIPMGMEYENGEDTELMPLGHDVSDATAQANNLQDR